MEISLSPAGKLRRGEGPRLFELGSHRSLLPAILGRTSHPSQREGPHSVNFTRRSRSWAPLLGSIDSSAWLPCYCDEYTSDRRGVDPAPDAGCG